MSDDAPGGNIGGLADVIALNRRAYDEVADEYDARAAAYEQPNRILLAPILVYLRTAMPDRELRGLDIGPGSGLDMAILESEGVTMTGVELSPHMARVARLRAPDATVVVADFLSWDPGENDYDVIVSRASLHLFPAEHAASYLTKCRRILTPGGLLFLSVSVADSPTEGIVPKRDFRNRVHRYKKGGS